VVGNGWFIRFSDFLLAAAATGIIIRFMRSFLVTGANSGVGLELTRALAHQRQRVILAVRDERRGAAARDEILRQHPQARLEVERVDLTDLPSVRALAARVREVDVLVNNAGVGSGPRALTAEGVLTQFAANHLGHFALTALMFERLAERDDARVVTVTSGFAKRGRIDLQNLDGSRGYGQGRAYVQSKLANLLFGAELDRRLRARGSPVKSVLAHPGVAATAMQQKPTGVMGVVARVVARFARPASDGATPLVAAAIGAGVAGGDLWRPGRRVGEPAMKEAPWPTMSDLEGAAALWARSEALAGVRFLSA
jgi:NAD(P)-dependent dehydrogenase (short-subunit alcohol dehydrogenase family)